MLDLYKMRMHAAGSYIGEARRSNAQNIMDVSWMRDAATKPVYVKWVDSGLPIVCDEDKVFYAKFKQNTSHNISGDEVAYLLQFRLNDIKENDFIKVGSYVQMNNELEEPEWWLIVHYDDRPQFREFSILKCLWTYRWISNKDGKMVINECLAVPRSQSSYNNGISSGIVIDTVESQRAMIMPSNDDSKTITYDSRFLISDPGRYPPLAWKISKITPSMNGAIVQFSLTQDQFNPNVDNAELMIADYGDYSEQPDGPGVEDDSSLSLIYSGTPTVRAGGSYKKFTLKELVDGQLVDVSGAVKFSIDFPDGDVAQLVPVQDGNVYKIKCLPDYSLVGKTFIIVAEHEDSQTSLLVEVVGL